MVSLSTCYHDLYLCLSDALVYPALMFHVPTPRPLLRIEVTRATEWGGEQMLENSSWRPGEYGNSGFQDISMWDCLFLLYLQKQNQRQYMERFKTAASEHKPLVQTLSNMKLIVQMCWPHTRYWLHGL